MESKFNDLVNLNYKMLSFIETLILQEKDSPLRGEHLCIKQNLINELNNLLVNDEIQNGGNNSSPEISPQKPTIKIHKLIVGDTNSVDKYLNTTDGQCDLEYSIDIPESEPLELHPTEDIIDDSPEPILKGGTKKKVKINAPNGKTDVSKLEDKLDMLWAENIRKLGRKLNIKGKNGKQLKRDEIVNRIIKNKKLHSKALTELNKFDLTKSES